MPKLFAAVDLPVVATEALARLQPPPMPGVRLAEPGQMHLTLHYLGEREVDCLARALQAVAFPAFALTLEGVGQFPSAGGAVTLWAGVRESATLRGLHAAVADALAGEGFRPEARRYTPPRHPRAVRAGSPGGRDSRVPGAASKVLAGGGTSR